MKRRVLYLVAAGVGFTPVPQIAGKTNSIGTVAAYGQRKIRKSVQVKVIERVDGLNRNCGDLSRAADDRHRALFRIHIEVHKVAKYVLNCAHDCRRDLPVNIPPMGQSNRLLSEGPRT